MIIYKKYANAFMIILFYALFSFSNLQAREIKADDIIGIWLIEEDGKAVEQIKIYKCDDLYCGKIIWINHADSTENPALDEKNKNKELRNRPLLGLEILKDFEFDGKDTWKNGKLYAHRKGKFVSPKLTLVDKNNLKIQVKILFLKKSFVWKRVVP